MPTPVAAARQCLTTEAANALDEAVAVARRRAHAQTTSLHAVSALLFLPSSPLRDACARARNSAYSPRLQFKALELCLGVSLDRLPSSQRVDDTPPISNSLMAAIKRSQANQKRQPENYHLYQQQQQSSSISAVKVELQHLILSILDDPVVSRVFGESGFRSCDIKVAIFRPLPHILQYPRPRFPPFFLGNNNVNGNSDTGRRQFPFPFSGFPATSLFNGDENSRRIGEVLSRNKGKNPLLVGVCAYDSLQSFTETLERKKGGILPPEISSLGVVCIEKEIWKFVKESWSDELINMRFDSVNRMVENCLGPGLVVNFGDLKAFIDDDSLINSKSCVVTQLTRLLLVHGRKLRFIGSVASNESYLKFINEFPSVEKDWDLQLLPITSFRPLTGDSCSKSSLMESFIPFGGLFSTSSDFKGPISSPYQGFPRCHQDKGKCEREVADFSNGGFTASMADQYQSCLPMWLQMAEFGTNSKIDLAKAKDDGMVLSAKVEGIHKKWDNICHRLHQTQSDSSKMNSQFPSATVGLQFPKDRKDNSNSFSNNSGCENVNPLTSFCLQRISGPTQGIAFSTVVSHSEKENSQVGDGCESPSSATSVTTDLGLGICSPRTLTPRESLQNFKFLFRALNERIPQQEEALSVISQTISNRRTINEQRHGSSLRGDIWFNFIGPDRLIKEKVAVSLAEISCKNRQNFINANISLHDMNDYELRFRGKTMIDYIAGELSRKPLSVVFLENIERADILAQNSLLQAIRMGKLSDSHGRDVSINNAIFVIASSSVKGSEDHLLESKPCKYSEDRILSAKGLQLQILVHEKTNDSVKMRKHGSSPKRKMMGTKETLEFDIIKRVHKQSNLHLDLNVPAEEIDSSPENSMVWLEDFCKQVDETVIFKPFDFDKLAEEVSKLISECFHKTVGSDCLLEIDLKVLDQIVSVAYKSDNNKRVVEDWVETVLTGGFAEACRKYNLTANSCVVKLVTCEGLLMEGQVPEVCLPSSIILS